jgi:class 3 adenylate cyclase
MLPTSGHAIKLLKGEFILDELHDVTLLYSDIKGFTPLSSSMHPIQLCELLNEIYSSFDKHLNEFGMYKVDIIGDAFVVIGGMPGYKDQSEHARNAVLFAFHMLEDIKNIKQVDLSLVSLLHTLCPCLSLTHSLSLSRVEI